MSNGDRRVAPDAFGPRAAAALRRAVALVEPSIGRCVHDFYASLETHPEVDGGHRFAAAHADVHAHAVRSRGSRTHRAAWERLARLVEEG